MNPATTLEWIGFLTLVFLLGALGGIFWTLTRMAYTRWRR